MAFGSISILWNKWNTRAFVMLSLLLQVFLVLFAPLRKKTTNRPIVFLLWLAYLTADWVAAFTIGLISHNQGNSSVRIAEVDGALQAFWASFLLLHLGGPDAITAFSLEDSSLWRRHLLNLILQVSSAIYVFVQIFPNDKSLVIPTVLVFLAGTIKNAERTLALIFSSLPRLREWVLSPHNLVEELDERWQEGDKMLVQELNVLGNGYPDEEVELAESIVVKHAYYFFQIFKIFLGDFMFTYQQRKMSREYFRKVSAMNALRVISVELHFIYEVLHTKALAICSKWSYIFRFIAFTNVVMAFVLFNRLKKHQLPELDVKITYTLLFGGIVLDVIALFMLVFSDMTVAGIKCCNTGSSKLDSFLHKLVSATDDLRKPRFATCKAKPNADVTYAVLDTPLIFRRWSESISACNLFSECFKESPRQMYKHDQNFGIITISNICSFSFRMAEKITSCLHQVGKLIARDRGSRIIFRNIANTKYVSKNPFMKELWIFIFKEMRRKSNDVDNIEKVRKIYEARGDLFLKSRPEGIDCRNLLKYVTKHNYDASIIQWHLASEILYNKEKPFTTRNDEREFSKILSDYILYLLLNQPQVVSAVSGIAQIISGDTVHHLRCEIIYRGYDVEEPSKIFLVDHLAWDRKEYAKSALGRGIDLAREIESLGETKWKVISGVWVEMLSYAASHIKGEAHVQVLSNGGELLAFVWLLIAHFGCFYKPGWGRYYLDNRD